jgi:hypothetical protein
MAAHALCCAPRVCATLLQMVVCTSFCFAATLRMRHTPAVCWYDALGRCTSCRQAGCQTCWLRLAAVQVVVMVSRPKKEPRAMAVCVVCGAQPSACRVSALKHMHGCLVDLVKDMHWLDDRNSTQGIAAATSFGTRVGPKPMFWCFLAQPYPIVPIPLLCAFFTAVCVVLLIPTSHLKG